MYTYIRNLKNPNIILDKTIINESRRNNSYSINGSEISFQDLIKRELSINNKVFSYLNLIRKTEVEKN